MSSIETLLAAFPVLESERLILRRLTLEDAKDFYTYYSDPSVTKYMDWNGPTSVEHAAEVIQAWNAGFENKTVIPWGITLRGSNQVIGTIVYIPIRGTFEGNPLYPTALGFELAPAYWKQGIMSEALKTVISFAFKQIGSHRIQAEVFPENASSILLLKKLGFQEEGLLRQYLYHEETEVYHDVVLLSLLKNEYE